MAKEKAIRVRLLAYDHVILDESVKKKGTFEQMTDGGRRTDLRAYYSLENQVNEQTPPAILLLSEDDKGVIPEHSWRYFEQLRQHGVQAELHILPYGGHGWGWKTSDKSGNPDPLHDGVREGGEALRVGRGHLSVEPRVLVHVHRVDGAPRGVEHDEQRIGARAVHRVVFHCVENYLERMSLNK